MLLFRIFKICILNLVLVELYFFCLCLAELDLEIRPKRDHVTQSLFF
jgi:hypothetical protein